MCHDSGNAFTESSLDTAAAKIRVVVVAVTWGRLKIKGEPFSSVENKLGLFFLKAFIVR